MKRRTAIKHLALTMIGAGTAVAIVGCGGGNNNGGPQPSPSPSGTPGGGNAVGAVYALTNGIQNQVITYSRASDGSLTQAGAFATGGSGNGNPLDSQGALILNGARNLLFACNPGTDEISVFSVSRTQLNLVQKVDSGGDLPQSLTIHGDLLYVLNEGTGANISGFRVGAGGQLTPLPNSTRMLSTAVGVPAQVQFNPAGNLLVVTQKATSFIDTYTVGANGLPSGPPPPALAGKQNPSVGIRPFGFAFRRDGKMIVSESFNVLPGQSAASSYNVSADGTLSVISGSVKNGQTDCCWVIITPDGRYAYTTNFISGTISSYTIAANGALTLLQATAANTGTDSQPEDMALSADGRYLYAILTGTGRVGAYRIEANGALTAVRGGDGLPAMMGAIGLAAS